VIRHAILACLALALAWAGTARAHEVRPALVQISQQAPGDYDVTWKRPVVGDMALRLRPNLSSGVLETPPTSEQAAPGHLIRVWKVRGGAPLDGQTLEIEGLAESVTDVLVRISTHDGKSFDHVVRPARPTLRLDLSPARGVAVPGYLRLGVEHILTGFDHLLFVLGLLLIAGANWRLVKAITAFTVAHSLTLALAALGYMEFPSAAIEALVALSLLFLAVELARGGETLTKRRTWIVAFLFGLLHGLAFSGILSRVGLPAEAAPLALLLFNIGVELGQLAFIAAAIGLIAVAGYGARRLAWSPPRWASSAPAYLIGGLSAYWLIERSLAAVQWS
jgi:hydrogenase/urease accessory protein HupE